MVTIRDMAQLSWPEIVNDQNCTRNGAGHLAKWPADRESNTITAKHGKYTDTSKLGSPRICRHVSAFMYLSTRIWLCELSYKRSTNILVFFSPESQLLPRGVVH